MTTSLAGRLALAAVATLGVTAAPARSAQAPALDAVLERVSAYVADFIPRFANVVAVEDYEQRTTVPVRNPAGGTSPTPWRLRSDLLLVRYPLGEQDWMVFRDVEEVNGTLVRHAENRILILFAEGSIESTRRAALIAGESARYHIPGGSFAITNPVLGLALLQPHYQPRLRFTIGGEERSLGPGVRAVRFDEREVLESSSVLNCAFRRCEKLPPLLGETGRVRGTAWVDVASGRILRTEVRLSGGRIPGTSTSTTTFAHDDILGLTVPKEMRTTWTYERRPVNGIARYGEFRRFNVQTESQVQPTPQP